MARTAEGKHVGFLWNIMGKRARITIYGTWATLEEREVLDGWDSKNSHIHRPKSGYGGVVGGYTPYIQSL